MFKLIPKEEKFFDMFISMAQTLTRRPNCSRS